MADMAQDRLGRALMLRILALSRIGRAPAECHDSPTRFVKKNMVSGSAGPGSAQPQPVFTVLAIALYRELSGSERK